MFTRAKSMDANLVRKFDLREQVLKQLVRLNINAASRRYNRSRETVDSNFNHISLLI
jgi:hypothetical protein